MREVTLADIARLLADIRGTSSKNDKIAIAAEFLRTIPEDQLEDTARLMIGQPLPVKKGSLGIQWNDVAEFVGELDQKNLFSEPLSVKRVAGSFQEIAAVSGAKSRQRKGAVLRGLMLDASSDERDLLIGTITGDLRAGFSEGLLLEAIAASADIPVHDATQMLGTLGDIGETASSLLGKGGKKADASIKPMNPIRPMLAESAETIGKAMELLGGRGAFEYKLDGIRVQAHKEKGSIRVFSRRLTDITQAVPEIVSDLGKVKADSFILDGEVIAFKDRPLPFQEVMRRVTREKGIASESIDTPVRIMLFDVIYLDGENLTGLDYEKRTEVLERIAPKELRVPRLMASSIPEAQEFYEQALRRGHEGVMGKVLTGKYQLGKRSKSWVKVKKAVTIDVAIIGAEKGHGRRSRWYSNYHLGVRTKDGFAMIGKTFKGLTDAEFEDLTARLKRLVIEDHGFWISVRPEIVLEVAFNEIQRSPKYESKMALRFARVTRIRDDKGPDDIETLGHLTELFDTQFGSKARSLK